MSMATNGKRNREAGHQYEKDEVREHSRYFLDLATTRACNRFRDSCGIDIARKNEEQLGRLPLDISCKSATVASVPYIKYLEKMDSDPSRIPVVLHRRTKRPAIVKRTKKPGVNFITQGEYALTTRKGYERFLQHVYAVQLLRIKNPGLIEALEKEYNLELLAIQKQIKL